MSQLSKERLEEIRDYDTCVTLEESAEMARRLLASEAQEPVAWKVSSPHEWFEGYLSKTKPAADEDMMARCSVTITPLYTAPPVAQPVQVPDAIEPTYEAIKAILPTANPDEYACCVGADMWNACRAAMLKESE